MRDDRRVEPGHRARPFTETGLAGPGGRLGRAVEEDLHPDAHAEDRPGAGEPPVDEVGPIDGAQARHTGMEVTDPGDDQTVGREHRVSGSGELDPGPDPLQGPDGRADVAAAVVCLLYTSRCV